MHKMSAFEIAEKLGFTIKPENKSRNAAAANAIMGSVGKKHVAEFDKAGIEVKTIPLGVNGKPSQAMSFPGFNVAQLLSQDWDAEDDTENMSDLKRLFQRRFLFVIFKKNPNHPLQHEVLERVMFWTMPNSDIEKVRGVWEGIKEAFKKSRADLLPRISDKKIIHIRPKARYGKVRSENPDHLPDGTVITKQTFWLNPDYVYEQIKQQTSR